MWRPCLPSPIMEVLLAVSGEVHLCHHTRPFAYRHSSNLTILVAQLEQQQQQFHSDRTCLSHELQRLLWNDARTSLSNPRLRMEHSTKINHTTLVATWRNILLDPTSLRKQHPIIEARTAASDLATRCMWEGVRRLSL